MDRYFGFKEHGTTYGRESIAGLTTFLSMAYILFVNPLILGDAGMDVQAVFMATALAAAIGTLIMGILAKYPIALAPGMGLNAFFAYSVVIGMGIDWQLALFGVFVSGIIFILITVFKIREVIINAIPAELKNAAAAGIGLFIAFIGLKNAGIVVSDEATAVSLGHILNGPTLLACFGLIVTVLFMVRGIQGGIFYGMILTAIVGLISGIITYTGGGIVSTPPSLAPTFGQAFNIQMADVFSVQFLIVVLTFLFVDFFDTAGTLYGVANQAGFIKDNKLPRAGKALLADSSATSIGAILGTSTTTAYIESSAGVAAGGRTGFASIVTAGLFVLAMFFSPLLSVVTEQVTAAALIVVGILMASSLRFIDWTKLEIAIPSFLTVVAMPLTYSIATGIAFGFLFYPITMIVKGRGKEVHPIMYALFFVFLAYFIFLSE
ncbi:NCS2 family permease [Halalkalibacterium halodurans]|uniref:BH0608 protein n=1 Tax=Halalkalibacterium halodurans (strain ATCC BAA-125 / DSM 18197 / FERM 7344 / JCM 9153 / C-125) TaxID=272558 RepID=Q9KF77_HALH5|nr:NCS2 family permease [Halalkalibacterium halodurans]MED4124531.1 NCS2 family permease [Halalkalibacterium halodurans]MED4173210.1 NCS2 family permease [Halalkalibacterium halodurans]BAB04327.1 BH0608 [Halalkalibacterium halodurans C-125]